MEFSRQEYWSGLPFPSPVDHILSELSTMTHPSWVALQGIAHSFIELDKAVVHVIRLVSFLWLWFSVCLPSDALSAPTVLLGFLLPWTRGISSWLLQQSTAAAPYLGHGVAPLQSASGPLQPPRRLGADCGSDQELLISKFRLKVEKTTRPFRYDLNQIPYD